MRYPPGHKQASRTRLVEAGAALAKKEGFSNTGMDAIMAAAGMTTGAFYSQFHSKQELLQAIVEHELAKTLTAFDGKSGDAMLKALAAYLSPYHAGHPEQGCPIPALGAEIARASIETRTTFESLIVQIKGAFNEVLQNDDAAWAMICQAIGGIVVARAMATPERQQEVLKAVLANARNSFS